MSSGVAPRAATARVQRARPAVGGGLILAGAAGAVVTVALVLHASAWPELAPVLLPVPWLAAAALAVRARPDHPGALLFLGLGAGHLTAFALSEPVSLDARLDGWAAWTLNTVATVGYLAGFAALGGFLATYPTGVPATVAERWLLRGGFGLAVLTAVAGQLVSDPVVLVAQGGRPTMPAPAGLPLVATSVPFVVVGPLVVVAGAVLLVVRSRRATGEERRQLSWAVGAAGLLALLLLATPAVDRLSPVLQTVTFLAAVSVLPFVLLAGLVRYRLMDVDLYVARTLARGVVVVLVLSVYALVTGLAGRSTPAVAAVLAVLAALTGLPLVRVLERQVDRWLSGGRVRGRELLHRLSDQLTALSPAEQARRAAQTVRAGMDASWTRLVTAELDLVVGAPPPGAVADVVAPLVAGSTEVGRLECGPRHGGWGAADVAELVLLGRHIALAVHNAELAGRLERQVVELTASRRRIVRAELGVRERLERDLHDGVQQQVVAVIAHLGALRVLLAGEPRAAAVAGTALDQARAALADLRHVVAGVQPPVLQDQGLVAAVRSRAALLPVPVRVDSDDGAVRWPADVEGAAYYVVSEALTNVVKHARAGLAEVRVGQEGGELVVSVRDDGIGLPPAAAGSGLAGLRDRVEALGGRLDLRSAAAGTGAGTVVTARLPLGPVPGD